MGKHIDNIFNEMMLFVNSADARTKENFEAMQGTFHGLIKKSIIKKKTDKILLISAVKDEIANVKK